MMAKSVLIADDDADILTALTLRLEEMGMHVRIANDATAALMMVHLDPPSVLIMDINMPGGNGLSVCEMLNTDPRRHNIPAIVLTGRTDAETITRCEQAGVHYVAKGGDVWKRVQPILGTILGDLPKSRL